MPAASKRKLRPVLADMARRPTKPRLIAAIAGVTMPPVRPWRTSATNTRLKVGMIAKMRADTAIMPMPIAASPPFPRYRINERPAGNMRDKPGNCAHRQGKANLPLLPTQFSKIKSNKRTKTGLDIG